MRSAGRKNTVSKPRAAKKAPRAPAAPIQPGVPIVAIGASAGGLDAFRRFLAGMPVPNGMAFVLIQHLDPTHESLMVELLAKHTTMRVVEVRQGMEIEVHHVYVIPPHRVLSVKEGVLHLSTPVDGPRSRTRGFFVDHFYQSLAEDQGAKAVGIILTGTGTDGTLGIRAIKAAGGMTMAQDPQSAGHDGMPRSAIGTGEVDYVFPVERLPEALLKYVRHVHVSGPAAAEQAVAKQDDAFTTILTLLRTRGKHDFRCYKRNTILRRIHRRMRLLQIADMPDYLELLRKTPAEVARLFKDILIGVTSFFRESKAFEELQRKVIARIVEAKEMDAPIRVWVIGCASGEEAYSLAMLFCEELSAATKRCPLQVFATDIDEEALETARTGVYPESIAAHVSTARLRRFFVPQERSHTYHVAQLLRECVIFASQNVISDPPFSKLDLISCRNLLIYLEPDVQRRIIRVFHFSLKPDGFLFLGSSEKPGHEDALFRSISKKWHIYRRQGLQLRTPDFPIVSAQQMPPRASEQPKAASQAHLGAIAKQILLDEFGPAAILANRKGEILFFYGTTGKYLDLPRGEPALNLLTMARGSLSSQLRIAIEKSLRKDATVSVETQVKRDGKNLPIQATVRPIRSPLAPEGLLLIVLQDLRSPAAGGARRGAKPGAGDYEEVVRHVEAELKSARDELRSTVEQMESANEELRASNEEGLSMNEELQSANEELETSKEEMQSLNEELSTVNIQLEEKVAELTETNNDLANLFGSTEIATVFLDLQFRIKRFTEASTQLLNLIRSDVGRPVSDLAHNLIDVDLRRDAQAVLRGPTPIRREVRSRSGDWFIMRVLPYRTIEGSVQGVVVTFTDVTDLLATSRRLEQREHQQELLAAIGRRALAGELPAGLLGDAVKSAAATLGAELGGLFVRAAEKESLLLSAGMGWRAGLNGTYTLATKDGSPIAHCFRVGTPLILKDVGDDPRFSSQDLLADHEANSGVLVRIESRAVPLGVLSVFTRKVHTFTQHDVNFLQAMAAVIAESIARDDRDAVRLLRSQALEADVERRTAWLSLVQDITRASNEAHSIDEALRYALRRISSYNGWQFGQSFVRSRENPDVLIPFESWTDERAPEFSKLREACSRTRPRKGEGFMGRVLAKGRIVMTAGLKDLEDPVLPPLVRELGVKTLMAFPVRVEKETVAILAFFSTMEIGGDAAMLELFTHVGTELGRVMERARFQEAFAEAIWQEQKRISEEIHDTVGQDLAGVGLMVSAMAGKAAQAGGALQKVVQEVSLGICRVSAKLRDLEQGLYPLEVDAQGLAPALQRLATTISELHDLPCIATIEGSIKLNDDRAALQLFRIAQEAVTNAVRHARPHEIVISLGREGDLLTLTVRDDGVGMSTAPKEGKGLGLRIMRNRASGVGAVLSIQSVPQGGTVVRCVLPLVRPVHEEGEK